MNIVKYLVDWGFPRPPTHGRPFVSFNMTTLLSG